MTTARRGTPDPGWRQYARWLITDAALIGFFALLGHFSHYGELSPAGIAATALPFLLAYAATTAILRPWHSPSGFTRTAVPLWIGTAVGGLILRVLLGESAASSFQVVALLVLGLFLLVPRGAAGLLRRHRRRTVLPTRHSPSRNQGAAT